MNVIYPLKISTVTASSEAAGYPDDNVLTDSIIEKWIAGATGNATLTFSCTAGANMIAIHGANADSISIAVDGGGISSEYEVLDDGNGVGWATYTTAVGNHTVVITFVMASGTVECGRVDIGVGNSFADISRQGGEGLFDHSKVYEMGGGGYYVFDKTCVRTFQVQLLEDRAADFYKLCNDILRVRGLKKPLSWRLVDASDKEWIIFAKCQSEPTAHNIPPNNVLINLPLIGAV